MKKASWFTILTLISILFILVLTGCNENGDKVSSVCLKDNDPNTAIEVALGEFDFSAYTVVATYETGTTEEVALTEEMIAEADLFKLYQIGEHDITVLYGGQGYTFKLSVKRATFGELYFPENTVFTYDGKVHTVEVDGNIPANASVAYPGGNRFLNAGTYDVVAIVSCEGYVTQKLSTTVTINRAKYDMSGVKFESKEFVYDGNVHSVAISGNLPEGVSAPTYTMNGKKTSGATNMGEYEVTASFNISNPNYEKIPDMKATLKITPAEYIVKGVDFVFKDEDGKVIDGTAKVYDGKSVSFDLSDYSKISKKISVAFSVFDEKEKLISSSNKKTNINDSGIYTVKIEFTHSDAKNYKPIAPMTCTFEVLKKDYPPIENVRFISNQVQYDGKEHSIGIEGSLPEGVSVSYEYYLGGNLTVDGENNPVKAVVNAGRYTVHAVFTHKDKNSNEIPPMSATLNIAPIEVDVSGLGIGETLYAEYDEGIPYKPQYKTWQEVNETDFDVLEYVILGYQRRDSQGNYALLGENEEPIDVGKYRLAFNVQIAEEYLGNYAFPKDAAGSQTLYVYFEIQKRNVAFPTVTFEDVSTPTDPFKVTYSHDVDEGLATVSAAYFIQSGGEYEKIELNNIFIKAGLYKFIVAVQLKDTEHNTFENGESIFEQSFEIEIKKNIINIDELMKTASSQYTYTGQDLRNEFLNTIDSSIKNYVAFNIIRIDEKIGEDWYEAYYGVTTVGTYYVQYLVSAKNSNNTELIHYGSKCSSTSVSYIFNIVEGASV